MVLALPCRENLIGKFPRIWSKSMNSESLGVRSEVALLLLTVCWKNSKISHKCGGVNAASFYFEVCTPCPEEPCWKTGIKLTGAWGGFDVYTKIPLTTKKELRFLVEAEASKMVHWVLDF